MSESQSSSTTTIRGHTSGGTTPPKSYQLHEGVEHVMEALQLYRTIFADNIIDQSKRECNGGNGQPPSASKYLNVMTWTERARDGLLILATTTTTKKVFQVLLLVRK